MIDATLNKVALENLEAQTSVLWAVSVVTSLVGFDVSRHGR
jgi:hypothetical protein